MEALVLIAIALALFFIIGIDKRVREILQYSEILRQEINRLREELHHHVSTTDKAVNVPPYSKEVIPTETAIPEEIPARTVAPETMQPEEDYIPEDTPDESLQEREVPDWIVSEEEAPQQRMEPAAMTPDEKPETDSESFPDENPDETPSYGKNWEKVIGVNLFSKIGILIFIIGIGFFVKYAIDQNWINEFLRTILAMGIGVSLWGIAYPLKDNYRNFSSILAGGGFAICFVSVAIGYHLYGVFGPTTSFIILLVLTAIMIAIAIPFNRPELAITAIIGGFAAPFIASNGSGSFVQVLAYMAILNSAVLAISIYKNWWILSPIACWLTYIITGIGMNITSGEEHNAWWLVATIYNFIVFSVPLITELHRNSNRSKVTACLISAIIINNLAYLCFGTWLIADIVPSFNARGCVALVGCIINLCIYLRYYKDRKADLINSLLITFISGMALAAILVQFTSNGIRFSAIGLYATIMMWMQMRTGQRIYRILSRLAGIPQAALLLIGATYDAGEIFGKTEAAWIYIVNGCAYLWCSRLIHKEGEEANMGRAGFFTLWSGAIILSTGMVVLFGYLLPQPIATWTALAAIGIIATAISYPPFNRSSTYLILPGAMTAVFGLAPYITGNSFLSDMPMAIAVMIFGFVYFRCATGAFRQEKITTNIAGNYMVYFNLAVMLFVLSAVFRVLETTGLTHFKSAAFSITLTICASVQMLLGMRYHSKLLRIISLAVLGIVIVKLAGYDLWKMAAIGRIIVFILLGAILLSISFLYQKLRKYLSD